MNNKYEIRGNVTDIFISINDGSKQEKGSNRIVEVDDITVGIIFNKKVALIDKDDKEKIMKFAAKFHINKSGYVVFRNKITKKQEYLHRFILNPSDNMMVDHINNDRLDNRKSNLRIVTNSENQQNRSGAQKNNKTSGVRGVSFCKKRNRWIASVKLNKKYVLQKRFDSFEDAKIAVEKARKEYMPFSKEYIDNYKSRS